MVGPIVKYAYRPLDRFRGTQQSGSLPKWTRNCRVNSAIKYCISANFDLNLIECNAALEEDQNQPEDEEVGTTRMPHAGRPVYTLIACRVGG